MQQGRERCHSSQRDMVRKRKRNMSVLVGMEAEEVQEQIVGEALKKVVMRKGEELRLKEMGPGGMAGKGKIIIVGKDMKETPIISAEFFFRN